MKYIMLLLVIVVICSCSTGGDCPKEPIEIAGEELIIDGQPIELGGEEK